MNELLTKTCGQGERHPKITCFSRYLSIETLVFRDSKFEVRQEGDDSELDVLGRTMEAEMNELLTKTVLSDKVEDIFWGCCMLRALVQNIHNVCKSYVSTHVYVSHVLYFIIFTD